MNQKWFKKGILAWREKMLHLAFQILNNREDAEDVVQEVFLKLWMTPSALSDIDKPEAYLTTMIKNKCFDHIKLKKTNEALTEQTWHISQSLEQQLEHQEACDIIGIIIEQLPELQKMMIRLHDIDHYTSQEIANNIGCKIDAVRMNLSRARKKVRELYQNYLDNEKQ